METQKHELKSTFTEKELDDLDSALRKLEGADLWELIWIRLWAIKARPRTRIMRAGLLSNLRMNTWIRNIYWRCFSYSTI